MCWKLKKLDISDMGFPWISCNFSTQQFLLKDFFLKDLTAATLDGIKAKVPLLTHPVVLQPLLKPAQMVSAQRVCTLMIFIYAHIPHSSQLWMHISNAFKLRNHPIRIGPATDCQINPGYEDGDEPRLPGAARGGKPSEHTLVRTDRLSRHRRYLFSHDLHNVMQYAACTKTHKKRVQTCLLHNQKRAKDVSQPGSFCTFKPSLAKVLDPMVPGLTSWLWDRWASLSSLGSMTVQCPTSKFLFH